MIAETSHNIGILAIHWVNLEQSVKLGQTLDIILLAEMIDSAQI